ncbi:putative quinone oxidoreductase [Trypanosoma theileri]|uniref:Putative quinone oxidoreductase n=1 Tax=Trypanosoma theileri TaxID=67003 RepID=A0A1X0P8R2_9TRYP|nr:putative quinone oxidoreductase [Trypanosoma theileri]ORC93344.1 putative quinone oxidoreductase [Trypanosoma theileri]
MQIEVPEYGSADVLRVGSLNPDTLHLADDEVLVQNTYAGVNFIDTYFRSGLYKKPQLPFIPGEEGAGRVVRTGAAVQTPTVGDRVVYFGSVTGSYATHTIVKAPQAAVLPDDVDDKTAAALFCQGLTAHYLSHDSYACGPNTRALVHAAAGGTGLLLCQLAKMRGAVVVGVCRGAAKAELARRVGGVDHVIDSSTTADWAAAAREIVPDGFDVVYDGVGRETFDGSLAVLRPRGFMISFGNASGAVEGVTPLRLMQAGSVYLQRPTLGDYIRDPAEKARRLHDLWSWVREKKLQMTCGREFPLKAAADAHKYLESRQSTGKIMLQCKSTE